MNTVVSFILVLGVLIFVHELGHFLFAKFFGVRVLKFSLGFGPKIFGKVVGDTEYVISALPLGGYVKMYGENPDEQDVPSSEKSEAFAHKTVWQRFWIVFAGPLFNFVFAIFLFFVLFSFIGVPEQVETTKIGGVTEGSPAAEAGILPGDIFLRINSQPTPLWEDVLTAVKGSEGNELEVVLLRGKEELSFQVTPKMEEVKNIFGEVSEKRYLLGIVRHSEVEYSHVGIINAFKKACEQTWYFTYLAGMGLYKIIMQAIPVTELGGPILIAKIAGEQMRAGWINLAYFTGFLSVNLGLLNLLPVPVLDGGHLVFLTIEGLRRKPLGERAQIVAQQIGLAFLGTLMIFVFYNDIVRELK